jgi:hypothetical protein
VFLHVQPIPQEQPLLGCLHCWCSVNQGKSVIVAFGLQREHNILQKYVGRYILTICNLLTILSQS